MEKLRIPFPTGSDALRTKPRGDRLGYPDEARPCGGHRRLSCDDETCLWCGRYDESTIARTFAARSAKLTAIG